MESILQTIKKMLGINETDTHFDPDVIVHINTELSGLNLLGVGPPEGFSITDDTSVWDDFISADSKLNLVISYIYTKVKLAFDPPLSSAVIESMTRSADNLEWRIQVKADTLDDVEEVI